MKEILHEAHEIKEYLLRTRRRLHSLAECGFDLPKTRDFVNKELLFMGYDPQPCGRCGIVATLGARDAHAPVVLLRADMDALPLREETRLPFRAESGRMHACGHDMHTAMLLGAAMLLRKREASLSAPVRFAFQGAEEILSGAADMAKHGVLSGVGAAFMLHVVPAVPYPTGTVLLPPEGIGAPSSAFFTVTLSGKAAHAGQPDTGCDALRAAVELCSALFAARERIGDGILLSIGTLHAGDAPNIVAGHATFAGTFRSNDPEKMHAFADALKREAAALSGGVTASVQFDGRCPALQNHPAPLGVIQGMLTENALPFLTPTGAGGAAAEDFAVFAERVPSVALALAAGEASRGYTHPLHHPAVVFDEDALPVGAALYAMAATALGSAHDLQTFTSSAPA